MNWAVFSVVVIVLLLFALLHLHLHELEKSTHGKIGGIQATFDSEKKRVLTQQNIRAQVCCECKHIRRKYDELEDGTFICHECKRQKLNA